MKRPHQKSTSPWTPETFAQLYDRYFPRRYAYIAYRVGHVQDAEDLVAETFLRIIQGLQHFQPQHESSLEVWLFRIAHNLVIDFYRRNEGQSVTLSLDRLPEFRDTALPSEELYTRQETNERLHQLINSLSTRRKEVITLKFFGQLRNQAIAEILELDERTVASHLCRGLKELQRHLTTEPDSNETGSTRDESAI